MRSKVPHPGTKRFLGLLLFSGLVCILGTRGLTWGRADHAPRGARAALAEGAHGFDFELGRWKIHIRRAQTPFADATAWDTFDGTTVNCSLRDGTEIQRWEADGPTGHIEGLTLRIYSPKSR
jgi:hypothetical protein